MGNANLVQILGILIPVLALATGLVAVIRMPKEAFLSKSQRKQMDTARLDELELQMSDLREQLAETQERLDFAERAMLNRPVAPPAPFITPV
jgi:uncharacterized protein HemX